MTLLGTGLRALRSRRLSSLVLFLACFRLAAAQDSPAQVDLRSLLTGGNSITMPLTPGERAQAESDALASGSDSVLSSARSHFTEYQLQSKNEGDARNRALAARRRLSDLALERDRVMDEMRRGFFCRACHRTRSQIEATGENWQEHLNRNSQGSAVPATPQELAAKDQEFQGRINSAKADEYHAYSEAESCAQAKAAAAKEVMDSFAQWRDAMLAEDEGRAKSWDRAIATY